MLLYPDQKCFGEVFDGYSNLSHWVSVPDRVSELSRVTEVRGFKVKLTIIKWEPVLAQLHATSVKMLSFELKNISPVTRIVRLDAIPTPTMSHGMDEVPRIETLKHSMTPAIGFNA